MCDLIHIGPTCRQQDMEFSKRLRERREAKERATTLSSLSQMSKSMSSQTSGAGRSKAADTADQDKADPKIPAKIPTIAKPKVRIDQDGKVVVDKSSLFLAAVNDRKRIFLFFLNLPHPLHVFFRILIFAFFSFFF